MNLKNTKIKKEKYWKAFNSNIDYDAYRVYSIQNLKELFEIEKFGCIQLKIFKNSIKVRTYSIKIFVNF